MALVKIPTRNGQRRLSRLYNPFDRLFRNDFIDLWDNDVIETIPSVNITEENDQYKVEMAAPGLKKEDFNIEVDGNLITISSEKESETKDKNEKNNRDYSRREYSYSSFSRSFNLPDSADTGRIVAKYNDGILSLNVPKKPEAQKNKSQKISVQ